MAADPSGGVRYLLCGRIADALRTKTAIAISALAVGLIVGMAIGQTVANRSQLATSVCKSTDLKCKNSTLRRNSLAIFPN